MNKLYHRMKLQYTPEHEPDWEFTSERDYWDTYNEIIQTMGELAYTLTVEDPENVAAEKVVNLHQCFVALPLEITVVEDEEWGDEEHYYGFGD